MKRILCEFCVLAFLFLYLGSLTLLADNEVEKPLFSFGILADAQYCDAPAKGARKYRKSVQKLKKCVDFFNSQNLDFVVQLGDLIDRDYASFDVMLPILKKIKAPLYNVLGNHDFKVDDQDKNKVMDKLGLENGFYDFRIKNWLFIILDGNELSVFAHPGKSEKNKASEKLLQRLKKEGSQSAFKWNGGMSEKQISWLRAKLEEAKKKKENVIIFSHYPIYPSSEASLWNDKELVTLIEEFPNVVAYMNGHHHKGHFAEKQGIYHVNFKGMVEFEKPTYALAEVYKDRIKIKGIGAEKDRRLNLTCALPAGGRISEDEKILLKSKIPDAKIFYTLDGSAPSKKSKLYTVPFTLSKDVTVRYAACSSSGEMLSPGEAKYIIVGKKTPEMLLHYSFRNINKKHLPDDIGNVEYSASFWGSEWVKTSFGYAMRFIGKKSGAGVYKNADDLNMGKSDWTVSVLFKIPRDSSRFYFVSGKGYRLETGGNFKGAALIFPPEAKHIEAKGDGVNGAPLNDGEWHRMTAVYKRDGDLSIYIDGKLSGKPVKISSCSGSEIKKGKCLRIFNSGKGQGACEIADLVIYKRALPAEDILKLNNNK